MPPLTMHSAENRFYVGTATKPGKSEGIYTGTFNTQTGTLSPLTLAATLENPTFIAVHPKGKFLYSISESKQSTVYAYSIKGDGSLESLNSKAAKGSGACHISLDASGAFVMIANYGDGTAESFPVLDDGSLGDENSFVPFTGSGPNKGRQEKPHAHQIVSSPDNKRVYVCDLGSDKIWILGLDPVKGITPLGATTTAAGETPAGAGPRHLVFHPKLPFLYETNELTRTVCAYSCNPENGELKLLQELSTLPPDTEAKGSSAEIAIHPNGQWLYVSNRGHDSIATYSINAEGILTFLEAFKIEAQSPRHFTLDPSALWVLSGGQNNDLITVNPIDPESGRLKATSSTLPAFAPACIVFVP